MLFLAYYLRKHMFTVLELLSFKLYVEKEIRLSVIFLPEVSPIHVLDKYFSFLMNQDRNL